MRLFVILSLVASLFLVGCSKPAESGAGKTTNAAPAKPDADAEK